MIKKKETIKWQVQFRLRMEKALQRNTKTENSKSIHFQFPFNFPTCVVLRLPNKRSKWCNTDYITNLNGLQRRIVWVRATDDQRNRKKKRARRRCEKIVKRRTESKKPIDRSIGPASVWAREKYCRLCTKCANQWINPIDHKNSKCIVSNQSFANTI